VLGVPREVSSGVGLIAARSVSPSTCLPRRIGWELKRMDLDVHTAAAGRPFLWDDDGSGSKLTGSTSTEPRANQAEATT
jgi:hypothetical protein